MYRFKSCQNPFHPFLKSDGKERCRCQGTNYVLSGVSEVPENDPRIQFSSVFRARHGLT